MKEPNRHTKNYSHKRKKGYFPKGWKKTKETIEFLALVVQSENELKRKLGIVYIEN